MAKEVNNENLVVKHNGFVEARYHLTKSQSRLVAWLIAKIGRNDKEFKEYKITSKDLVDLCGLSKNKAYGEIKSLLFSLREKTIEISKPNPDNPDEPLWIGVGLIEMPTYHGKSTYSFQIAKELKPYLLELKSRFTKLNLQAFLEFKNIYAPRIYEILTAKLGDKKSFTYQTEITEIRAFLGLSDDIYKTTFNLKSRVLEPAFEEINNQAIHTGIKARFELQKSRNSRAFDLIEITVETIIGAFLPDLDGQDREAVIRTFGQLGFKRQATNYLLRKYGVDHCVFVFNRFKDILWNGYLENGEKLISQAGFLREKIKDYAGTSQTEF